MGDHTIPTSLDDFTPEWLTGALGAQVTHVEIEPVGQGVGILGLLARLRLTYAGDSDRPSSVIAKIASSNPETVMVAVHYGFYLNEVQFYRDCASTEGLRVPAIHYSDIDESESKFVLLLEDLGAARLADQIAGCPPADAAHVMDAAAALHSFWWNSPKLADLTWLRPVNNDAYKSSQEQYAQVWPGFLERFGDRLPPRALAVGEAFQHRIARLFDWVVENRPMTIAHTDFRLDNLFFDHPDGSPLTIIDWQLSVRSTGAIDVGYFLAESLSVEDRRAHERPLLERYHAGLLAGGVTEYSFDELYDDYRLSLITQLTIPVIAQSMDPGNDRGRRLMDAMVERVFIAIDDHDAGRFMPV
jgi:aminoglycoside/choline kinase family phosphotransferase